MKGILVPSLPLTIIDVSFAVSYYLNCGERCGYPVSIVALVASLGCSRSQSEFAGSVDVVAGTTKEERRGLQREKERERESAAGGGEKNSSVMITGYRVAGVAPTTTLFYRYRAA